MILFFFGAADYSVVPFFITQLCAQNKSCVIRVNRNHRVYYEVQGKPQNCAIAHVCSLQIRSETQKEVYYASIRKCTLSSCSKG